MYIYIYFKSYPKKPPNPPSPCATVIPPSTSTSRLVSASVTLSLFRLYPAAGRLLPLSPTSHWQICPFFSSSKISTLPIMLIACSRKVCSLYSFAVFKNILNQNIITTPINILVHRGAQGRNLIRIFKKKKIEKRDYVK